MSLFDLNIETVLEHWEVEHGLREIIANALDECTLSGTDPITIAKDNAGRWHVQDYGRGIRIEHFTLNENQEKIGADGVIGKFGVGLKDALAALDRHHASVAIRSQHGTFTLTKAAKHNFAGITTLHISHEPAGQLLRGTDFILTGLLDAAIEKAKGMFLRFREHRVLDATPFGQVIAAPSTGSEVFINGVWVNAEPTFLFSYNVTSLTVSMRKALNRERVNVGRSVYADRIRQILKSSDAPPVLEPLASAYARRDEGGLPEELAWIDIAHKALNELAKKQNVVVISQTEIKARPELVEDIKRDGRKIVLVTDREKERADQQAEQGTAPFQTLRTWIQTVNDSFQYQFVEENEFTENERVVWQRRYQILGLVGLGQRDIPRILVSQTMRATEDGTNGVWDSNLKAVIVKRTQLRLLSTFAGTLLHECAHAVSGATDCTRFFENVLTDYLGRVSVNALSGARSSDVLGSMPYNEARSPVPDGPIVSGGITFVPVESSSIAGVCYDNNTQTLYVAFKTGSRYFYQPVPEPIYTALLNAPSKGRYLHAQIIGRYRYGCI